MTKEEFIKKYDVLGRALIKEYGLERAKEAMKNHYFGQYESKEDFDKHWERVPLKSFTNSLIAVEIGNKVHVFYAF
jgi:antirestriction protein